MGMFDGIGDAIRGITSAIGGVVDPVQGLVSAGLSAFGGSQANKNNWDIAQNANQQSWASQQNSQAFNAQQSQAQMDFQERMRKTQYQTAIQDLTAAGLNPMLAYAQGGAGTPSGSAASSSAAQVHTAQNRDAVTPAVTAYLNAKQNSADLFLKAEQAKATSASAEQSRTQSIVNTAQAIKTAEESNVPKAEIARLTKMLDVLQSQIVSNTAIANSASAQAAKTKQETDLGIVSSNPITQGWGELKRAGRYIFDPANRNNTKNIKFWK